MRPTGSALPPDVLASLDEGQVIEAIKRLRAATGLGLKEAKDLIDAHLAGDAVSMAAPAQPTQVPDAVRQALAEGHKIEAIRLLRDHEGLGLKEAKDRVDAIEQLMAEPASVGMGAAPGLSPGQQPSPGAGPWIVVAVVLLATVVAYLWMRGGG